MTLEQMKFAIEQIRKFSNQKKNPNFEAVDFLVHKTINYFIGYYFDEFDININKGEKNTSEAGMVADCNSFIFKLEGMLAADTNYPTVKNILGDIEKYKKCKSNKSIKEAIRTIYFSYSDRIKFDKVIEKIIYEDTKDVLMLNINNGGFDATMLHSMLTNLENYANEICSNKSKSRQTELKHQPQITINNSNTNTFNASVGIDIAIKNAYEALENACLSSAQDKLVKEKLDELEKLIKSNESKSSKWSKFKSFLKWVAEQGIQVAGIVVPLIANALSK